jgi:hypothetical protein
MLRIGIIEGRGAGTVLPVDRTLIIGSGPAADLRLADACVSPEHARIAIDGDAPSGRESERGFLGATIEDLCSSNGTFVNGQSVAAPTWIEPGDELLVGTTVLTLDGDGARHGSALARAWQLWGGQVSGGPAAERPSRREIAPATAHRAGELTWLLDGNVKRWARIAPWVLLAVVAVIVTIYIALD